MKKQMKSILVCISTLLMSFCLVCNAVAWVANEPAPERADVTEDCVSECLLESEDAGAYITLETTERRFLPNTGITVSFIVSADAAISDVTYTLDGIASAAVSVDPIQNNRVVLALPWTPNLEDGSCAVEVTLADDSSATTTLHIVSSPLGSFISDASADMAREYFFDYAIEEGILTEEACQSIRESYWNRCVESTPIVESTLPSDAEPQALVYTAQVKAYVTWKDDDGVSHPVRNAKVYIFAGEDLSSAGIVATVHTSNGGRINERIPAVPLSPMMVYIRVYAGDDNAMVKSFNDDMEEITEYCCYSGVATGVLPGNTVTLDTTIRMSTDAGRAMQISQVLLTVRDYAEEMMGETPAAVRVRYPVADDGCSYTRGNKIIHIKAPSDDDIDDLTPYASWDVIAHEYGHHIQHELGNRAPNTHYYDGGHYSSAIHLDGFLRDESQPTDPKTKAIQMTWSEAWPTVFGTMAHQYYADYLTTIYTANDTCYTAYNGVLFDLEYITHKKGETCEQSVMAVLWDIYDSGYEMGDHIALGHTEYWSVTTPTQCKSFSDFISYFYTQYPSDLLDLGDALSKFEMAATVPTLTNREDVSATTPPTYEFDLQGGSEDYPNNKFCLCICDSDGNIILSTPCVTTASPAVTYTLSDTDWAFLIQNYASETPLFVCVKTWHASHTPVTGPYYSELTWNSLLLP